MSREFMIACLKLEKKSAFKDALHAKRIFMNARSSLRKFYGDALQNSSWLNKANGK